MKLIAKLCSLCNEIKDFKWSLKTHLFLKFMNESKLTIYLKNYCKASGNVISTVCGTIKKPKKTPPKRVNLNLDLVKFNPGSLGRALMVCPPHVPTLLLHVMLGGGGWESERSQPLTWCMCSHAMSSSCPNLVAVCHAGWWWVGEWEKSATHMMYVFSCYVLLMSQPCCCVSCWVVVGGRVGEVSHSHDVCVLMLCPPHVPTLLLHVMLGGGGWESGRSQPLTWCMCSHAMSSSCPNLVAVCHAGWWWVGEWEKSATHMMFTMLTGCNIHDIYMLYGHYGNSRDELHWSSLD